jgi:hypothetical protein
MGWLLTLWLSAMPGWELVTEKDGMTVERRRLPDADYLEVRVRVETLFTPDDLFNVIWDTPKYPSFVRYAKSMKILHERGQERIIYQQNRVPLIQDRDYTVRSWYERDAGSGLIQVFWQAANELGPPESADYVRLQRNSGSWTLEPAAGGKTIVTYVVASEAGGMVPAWLVRTAQTDAAPEFLRTVLDRVAQVAKEKGR